MKRRVHEARVPASCWGPGVRVLRFGVRSVIVIATVRVGPSGERTAVAEGSRAGSVIRGHPQICERSSGNQHRLLWGPGTGGAGSFSHREVQRDDRKECGGGGAVEKGLTAEHPNLSSRPRLPLAKLN